MNRPRNTNESFEQYKDNLYQENKEFKKKLSGKFIHVSSVVYQEENGELKKHTNKPYKKEKKQ